MLYQPFYDPTRSYEENFQQGPFFALADKKVDSPPSKPKFDFLGYKVNLPFGIPAGPLLNGRFVKKALDYGYDLVVYKTVRTRAYPCHPWPNILAVKVNGDLTLAKAQENLQADANYQEPLSITNSFGVPSAAPDYWQQDLAEAVNYAKPGQLVIASFQGTKQENGSVEDYIQDFVLAAKLLQETGVKVIEMNLSCPNEGTNDLLCFDIKRTQSIVQTIKNEVKLPLILKIAYFKEEELLRKFVHALGDKVEGISAINTIAAPIVDDKGEQALPGENRLRSGVCGQAIKWAGLDMVKRLTALRKEMGLSFTIIGVGGVLTPEDYNDYRKIGADAVMSATGAIWNPFLAQEIKERGE